MTLIKAFDSSGTYARCDAKCHDAEHPKCDCICGGKYHGKKSGTQALRDAVQETGDVLIAEIEKRGGDPTVLKKVRAGTVMLDTDDQFRLF